MKTMTSREMLDAFDRGLAEARRPFELERERLLGDADQVGSTFPVPLNTVAEDGVDFDRSA